MKPIQHPNPMRPQGKTAAERQESQARREREPLLLTGFEADLCPDTQAPRMRFNFANGWSASIVLRMMGKNGCDALMASVAACPSGQWGKGKTILGPTEASADEAMAWMDDVRVWEAA